MDDIKAEMRQISKSPGEVRARAIKEVLVMSERGYDPEQLNVQILLTSGFTPRHA
jgi:hypothetical protein